MFTRALAEKEGFEPPVPCGTPVFKTSAFDHSATSPTAKVVFFLIPAKNNDKSCKKIWVIAENGQYLGILEAVK